MIDRTYSTQFDRRSCRKIIGRADNLLYLANDSNTIVRVVQYNEWGGLSSLVYEVETKPDSTFYR